MKYSTDAHRYDDIIHLPHHQSKTHPHMPMAQRAAQFVPFSTLRGYDEQIAEVHRPTEPFLQLSDTQKDLLSRQLNLVNQSIMSGNHPHIRLRYFIPDLL